MTTSREPVVVLDDSIRARMANPAFRQAFHLDMFAQADALLARSEGGLGIGLTLVRSLVEAHAGRSRAKAPERDRAPSSG